MYIVQKRKNKLSIIIIIIINQCLLGFNPNQELACNSPTFQLIHPNNQTKTDIDWMLLCASGHFYWFWQSKTWNWLGFRVVSEFIVFQDLTIERSSVAHSYSVSSVFFYGIVVKRIFHRFPMSLVISFRPTTNVETMFGRFLVAWILLKETRSMSCAEPWMKVTRN